ncbi:hypothetical protein [Paracoccus sediminis]|uniref:Uncharacterized protein n=1 Tax=Paracoccus sediminis TaxID=1214787 RepID=A0A238XTE4_9RHOB|nr:hypothetical protein [Paracoccus sediminis]SNR61723.1 hypothetical protein SAMN06265378_11221 [Paracoccus sediminis]
MRPPSANRALDVELLNWRAVFDPPDMSDGDKARMIDVLTRLNASEAWQTELASRSWTPLFLAGDEFAVYLNEDTARIRTVLEGLGLVAAG